jgi:NADH-quinone oxidoreductase subunit E
MSQLPEILLWILLAFFVGCIVGYLFATAFKPARRHRNHGPATEEPLPASPEGEKPDLARLAGAKVPMTTAQPRVQTGEPHDQSARRRSGPKAENAGSSGSQPKGIPAPRGGSPDSLQRISGVGPKIESTLHRLGIFHFDQIAGWTHEEEQWVDEHLKFRGRIARDEWVKQAKLLANGKEEEFVSLFGSRNGAGKKAAKAKGHSRPRTS